LSVITGTNPVSISFLESGSELSNCDLCVVRRIARSA